MIRPLLAVESGGQWQAGLQGPVPADTSDYVLVLSASCASAGNCAAVGGYHKNGSEYLHGLLLSESGGSWSAAAASLPADAAENAPGWLNWVSCPSAGNCAAVGWFAAGSSQGLLLSETGGTWGTGADVLLPPSVDTRITHLTVKKRTVRITVLGVGRVLPLSFECRLDHEPFVSCPPTQAASQGAAAFPVRYKHLAKGRHMFEVETVDQQGTADPTPAFVRFRVK
jgi:hypothetical protein